jgi:hypothetical protein
VPHPINPLFFSSKFLFSFFERGERILGKVECVCELGWGKGVGLTALLFGVTR